MIVLIVQKQVLVQAQICGGPATWLCAVTIASLSRLSSVAISMNSSGTNQIRRNWCKTLRKVSTTDAE